MPSWLANHSNRLLRRTVYRMNALRRLIDADNWTYKRQAWTLVTTPEGQPSDLMQGPNDVFTGNWLDDVVANGGGEAYVVAPKGI